MEFCLEPAVKIDSLIDKAIRELHEKLSSQYPVYWISEYLGSEMRDDGMLVVSVRVLVPGDGT